MNKILEIDVYRGCGNNVQVPLDIGTEFYLIETQDLSRPTDGKFNPIWTMSKFPGRTNISGEERAEGQLGTTDNIHRQGLGKFRIIARGKDGKTIDAEKIEEA